MVILRNYKFTFIVLFDFMLLLAAVIYKDYLIFLCAAVAGMFLLYYLMKSPVRLIYFQVFYNLFVKFAIGTLGVPSAANYLTDIITICIVIAALKRLCEEKGSSNIKLPMVIVIIFFFTTVAGLMINGQSILLFLWGIRNNFRFYGFFFGCAVLLKKKDIDFIINSIMYISVINLLFCLYQYNIQHYSVDNLGGIFGTNVGVNIYLNVFICITTVITVVRFIYQRLPAWQVVFTIFTNVYISAIGELKVFYIEVAAIVLCLVLFFKPSRKTVLILISCAAGVYFGIQFFYTIFPSWQNFFRIDKIISSGQNYASSTDLGRFSAAKRVTDMFLSGDLYRLLFGLGLGSAEISQVEVFTSNFYIDYGNYLHYTWLSQAFLLIETGWIGLCCVAVFFISTAAACFRIRKERHEYLSYCVMTQVFAVISCMLLIYNSTLRTEAGYLVYFFLSMPFALYRNGALIDALGSEVNDGEN